MGGASSRSWGGPDRAIASPIDRAAVKLLSAVADTCRARLRRAALCALLAAAAATSATAGRDVVLRLKDGDIEIAGELRSFDGHRYIVAAHGFGELVLEAARFECVSGACRAPLETANAAALTTLEPEPTSVAATPGFTIDAAPPLERELLPALIRGYAGHLGGSAKQMIGGATDETRFAIVDRRGHPLADITVRRRTSDAVFADLRSGAAALGAATRAPGAGELGGIEDGGGSVADNEHVLGLDGLAVIVPTASQARRLTAAELARIISGEVTDWSSLGLPQAPIQVYVGAEHAVEAMATVVRPNGLTLTPAARRIADEAELSDAVARDPGGIGITSITQVRNARALDIVQACGLPARPTEFAIKAEEYPLGRRLYLYASGKALQPMAQDLVRFAASRAGQLAVRDGGLVDQTIATANADDEKDRLTLAVSRGRGTPATQALARRLAADAAGARRMSLTFRFATNSSGLDAKGRGDIPRLAELLSSPEFNGRTVVLIGFTDAPGAPAYNAALSLRRAEQVRDAVLSRMPDAKAAGRRILARGAGPVAPVACNAGDKGQFRNRRVEVWVRNDKESNGAAARPEPGLATSAPLRAADGAPRAKASENAEATIGGEGRR